jgi:hypothetical protein
MRVTTSQDPCPSCGSPNVSWRNRRFYDVLLTWLTASFSSAYFWTDDGPWAYDLPPEVYTPPLSLETPERFWKCPDCLQSGEEFEVRPLGEKEQFAGLSAADIAEGDRVFDRRVPANGRTLTGQRT